MSNGSVLDRNGELILVLFVFGWNTRYHITVQIAYVKNIYNSLARISIISYLKPLICVQKIIIK